MLTVKKLLQQLIEISSLSGEEKEIGEFVFNLLQKKGFTVAKQMVDATRFNVVATVGKPKIYLQAHMDTVAPYIPYKEDEAFIYGRGACDTKAAMAGMICAAIAARNQGLTDFGLLFTTAEETTFDGAQTVLKNNIDIPFVIVGEPTSLKIVNAHYGFLAFQLTAKGKAAHSSKPKEGINAIELLLPVMQKVREMNVHPESILTLAKIEGGVSDNVIPESASALFSMRISPNDSTDYIAQIQSFLPKEIICEVQYNVASVQSIVPKELSFITDIYSVEYFTELSFFQKGVIIGPGSIDYAHGNNEKVLKKEVEKSVEVYLQILRNFIS